jgi:hypothetical protein
MQDSLQNRHVQGKESVAIQEMSYVRHYNAANERLRYNRQTFADAQAREDPQREVDVSDEIDPYLVCRVEQGALECALWQMEQGERAVALFLTEESAQAYRQAAELADWLAVRPSREALLEVLSACHDRGINFAVLDPDQRQARRVFDLGAVLRAARLDGNLSP